MRKAAIATLTAEKETYTVEDHSTLKECLAVVESDQAFPELGERYEKKKALSSKTEDLWRCACGHDGNTGKYCYKCLQDIQGFYEQEPKPSEAANALRWRLAALEEVFEGSHS